MTVNVSKSQFNIREKLKDLERPSTDKLVTRTDSGVYIDKLGGVVSLSNIHKVIDGTATDAFIYDTSKDSDGGAWRKRTSHTSWYNETLNTATRGSRREFPAVAVIVTQNGTMTIYDGDDPDLPMWMKWTPDNSARMIRNSTTPKIASMNGIIALSSASTYGGVVLIYFISDTASSYRALASSNNTEGFWKGNIAGRNDYSSNNYSNSSGGNDLPAIVAENTKDVAMTVLPNAPIDSATGLPVPTIAVATAGGPSVIKDDGTVVNYTRGGNEYTGSVAFDELDDLIISWGTTVGGYRHATRITNPFVGTTSLDSTYGYIASDTGLGGSAAGNTNGVVTVANSGRHFGIDFDSSSGVPATQGNHDDRVDFLHINDTDTTKSLVAFVNSSYNTGWMHGDIKGAFLSDTDTTNAVGTELVTNGTFDSNTDWTLNTGWSISSGKLRKTDTSNTSVLQSISTVIGKTYVLSVTVDTGANNSFIYAAGSYTGDNMSTAGTFSRTFKATSTNTQIGITGITGNGLIADNISVRLADPDRSINNKGLAVIGTITKTPVATGAELVAYSGYSSSNYFVQPSITAPGTGDFSVTCWIKPGTLDAGSGNYVHLFSLGTNTTGGQGRSTGFTLKITTHTGGNANGYSPYLYSGDGGTNHGTYNTSAYIPLGKWSQLIAVRHDGVAYIYHDGELMTTGNSWTTNLTDTYLTVFRGIGYNEYGGDAKVALLRYSRSAPTAEQIKKMYEDEKHLFQENAKCTLYGSSDAVTALAYDEVTDQLHVGTSSGRSDFQGLRRINNTTTAVTTAISAHDEFIIEQ